MGFRGWPWLISGKAEWRAGPARRAGLVQDILAVNAGRCNLFTLEVEPLLELEPLLPQATRCGEHAQGKRGEPHW